MVLLPLMAIAMHQVDTLPKVLIRTPTTRLCSNNFFNVCLESPFVYDVILVAGSASSVNHFGLDGAFRKGV